MDLKKNFIPKSLFQKILFGLILIFAGLSVWGTISVFKDIQSMFALEPSPPTEAEGLLSYTSSNSFNSGSFQFTQIATIDTSYMYVTLTDLTSKPTKSKSLEILASFSENDEILGLVSSPSFFVQPEHRSFWIYQVYLEFALIAIGSLLIIGFFVGISTINFKKYQKIFTKEIYRWIVALYLILFIGFIADALLYARKIHFINTEFNLSRSITGGISPSMVFVLILLLLVIIFLHKGIPMQNEQDLTV